MSFEDETMLQPLVFTYQYYSSNAEYDNNNICGIQVSQINKVINADGSIGMSHYTYYLWNGDEVHIDDVIRYSTNTIEVQYWLTQKYSGVTKLIKLRNAAVMDRGLINLTELRKANELPYNMRYRILGPNDCYYNSFNAMLAAKTIIENTHRDIFPQYYTQEYQKRK